MDNSFYLNLLGLSESFTEQELKKAYRQRADEFHPDRFANAPDHIKRNAEEQMKQINEAYKYLQPYAGKTQTEFRDSGAPPDFMKYPVITSGRYRYTFMCRWGDNDRNFINFIFRNPVTFDGSDDWMIRSERRARHDGFDGVLVTNIFAVVEPGGIKDAGGDLVGPENDKYIKACAEKAKKIVVAWGNEGTILGRHDRVMRYLPKDKLYCWYITGKGAPGMPAFKMQYFWFEEPSLKYP